VLVTSRLTLSVLLQFCMRPNFVVVVRFTNNKHDHLPRLVLRTAPIPVQ